jgi:hypothetical protein
MTELEFKDAGHSVRAPTTLERLIPLARRRVARQVELGASAARLWELVRHADLARTPLLRAFLGVWSPARAASSKQSRLRVDDFRSTPERPGFQILADEPSCEFSVGAIARLRRLRLAFVHVDGAADFIDFAEPGYVKLAWSVRVTQRRAGCSRLSFELRIGATDASAWRAARWYFTAIGPGIDWVIQQVLGSVADQLGWPTRLGGVNHAPAH